jgi:LmbE family N-acetylglucosaminyl deacetylase
MVKQWSQTRFVWVTLSSDVERAAETRNAAAKLLSGSNSSTVLIETFRGSYFPHDGIALKDYFESLKTFTPELVLTHFRHDLHQDHRITNELTWNTFRDHAILEYEIPKFDGDLGVPNSFVCLTKEQLDRKIEVLLECFPSQCQKPWFSRATFEALARLRGIECNAPEGYAEAFYGRKFRLSI